MSPGNGIRRRARQLLDRNDEIKKIMSNSKEAEKTFYEFLDSIPQITSPENLNKATEYAKNIISDEAFRRLNSERFKNLDEYYSLPVQHEVDKRDFLGVMQPHPFRGILKKALESKHLSNIASQLYGYNSRHYGYQRRQQQNADILMSGTGADIVDLHNNVIRLTPDSKQANALFNEFVESKYPSVLTVKEYKSNPNRIVGDMTKFPVSNINLFAGIEDGKFKIDYLDNFNNNSTVIPARNIKSGMQRISKINITPQQDEERTINGSAALNLHNHTLRHNEHILGDMFPGESGRNELDSWMTEIKDLPSTNDDRNSTISHYIRQYFDDSADRKFYHAFNVLQLLGFGEGYPSDMKSKAARIVEDIQDTREKEIIAAKPYHDFMDKYFAELMGSGRRGGEKAYTFIGEDGNEYPISSYNASVLDGKTLLGNENGSYFIGRLQDISQPQLDSLNSRLANDPMWLMRTDLGSFNQYRLDRPSLEEYLQQYFEHPRANDPNVYTVGTTTPNIL